MAPHGFAVVGAGLWGGQHARVLSTLPEADLVAVCDVDASRAEAMRTRFGARHAYTDLTGASRQPGDRGSDRRDAGFRA